MSFYWTVFWSIFIWHVDLMFISEFFGFKNPKSGTVLEEYPYCVWILVLCQICSHMHRERERVLASSIGT